MSNVNLRDALLKSLATLSGIREFHLHALVSSPRKHSTLYPFSKPRCRSYLQDILILLSEQSTPDSPRLLVTVIEACVYNVPSTSCAILYISKIDSTGQCTSPSPTAPLVRALLLYYADASSRPVAADHLWIQLFARAQSQYLFPNSADFPGKRPLGDVQLCGWWKQLFTNVAAELESRGEKSAAKIRLFYNLPGYSQIEAEHSLKPVNTARRRVTHNYQWAYGHPYSQTEIPLPCPGSDIENVAFRNNLGHFIPSFDDDPKSRFMDEIAYTTGAEGIKSPPRKRARTASSASRVEGRDLNATVHDEGPEGKSDSQTEKDDRPLGELGKVSVDEFWERMSFRQECVAGAVTGFFALGTSSTSRDGSVERTAVSPLAPQPGQVSSKINKRIITSLMTGVEFSTRERAIRATEVIEGTIRGLCEGIAAVPAPIFHAPRPKPVTASSSGGISRTDEEAGPSLLAPPRTPPPRMANGKRIILDVSPNPFPEPEASLETYESFIYGSVSISNPIQQNKDALNENKDISTSPVTILTVRRKKKRLPME